MRRLFFNSTIVIFILLAIIIIWNTSLWWIALLFAPLIILGYIDYFQKSNNIRRTYPLLGRLSNLIEKQRHVIQEILLLDRKEGEPFNWIEKEIAFKRADNHLMNQPFGTQLPYSETGREWLLHTTYPTKGEKEDFRVKIGSGLCKQPYNSSILNIGGMSYGSISSNATLALNGGAQIGGFAQNTGEGGLTDYHEKHGADLIFQFGTGYFGCRDEEGNFDKNKFKEIANNDLVKMVEIKVSQGAKPGYGAMLPASKNTKEIAKYRDIDPHEDVESPPNHSAFSNHLEMINFIDELRTLSNGKPIGIKLCIGNEAEFEEMIKSFVEKNSYPDFITIDGAEGGTGAAHLEALHWVGMPLEEALYFVNKTLSKSNLRKEIKIIAGGKLISAFDLFKMFSLGADACYSARAMMIALGCVQSLKCNSDACPTGITTMVPSRVASLVVNDKKAKVANYHKNTLDGLNDLLIASGSLTLKEIKKTSIMRRVSHSKVISLEELYPS